MKPFEFAVPISANQAVGLLGSRWGDSEILAGGTDLLALMKDDVVSPKRLVNIKSVAGMNEISYDAKAGLRLGALARLQDIADHADMRSHYPVLANAVDDAASPQIRNMATIGGNLCQRPRCWYFRNGFGLLAEQNGKSLVTEGDNRYHAILGNDGPAKFVSPSSIAPVLIAMQARVRLVGPNGPRELPLEKFFVIPKSENEREHNLRPNEMLTELVVPPAPEGWRFGAYEVRQKAQFDWPLATAAVALKMSGGKVQGARIVMGHVAPIPWIAESAAVAALMGEANLEKAAENAGVVAAIKPARPLSRNGHKARLAAVAVKRAILAAAKTS
ncbi:MAG: FAD binding domain-containing protein [Terriglobales bacterium]